MFATLIVLIGLSVTLYFVLWAIKQAIAHFQPALFEQSSTAQPAKGWIAPDLTGLELPVNGIEVDIHSVHSLGTEIEEAIPLEGMDTLVEVAQKFLEGAGEHLVNLMPDA
jgi:hypothetical protein